MSRISGRPLQRGSFTLWKFIQYISQELNRSYPNRYHSYYYSSIIPYSSDPIGSYNATSARSMIISIRHLLNISTSWVDLQLARLSDWFKLVPPPGPLGKWSEWVDTYHTYYITYTEPVSHGWWIRLGGGSFTRRRGLIGSRTDTESLRLGVDRAMDLWSVDLFWSVWWNGSRTGLWTGMARSEEDDDLEGDEGWPRSGWVSGVSGGGVRLELRMWS